MAETLITFLGKTTRGPTGYRRTAYRLPDGRETPPTEFLGLALGALLPADRVVILGTRTSMWDVLADVAALEAGDEVLAVSAALEGDGVTDELLAPFSRLLSGKLEREIVTRVIPYAVEAVEQSDLLRIIRTTVEAEADLSLDLTHGLRHLPMLGLLSALFLQSSAGVRVRGLYYGAYDRTPPGGPTPIYRLDGVLELAAWIQAGSGFSQTGEYAALAPLLERAGVPAAIVAAAREATFFENTLNAWRARRAVARLDTYLDREGLPGSGAPFTDVVRQRTAWAQNASIVDRQRDLARRHLAQGDYLRATLTAFEALLSRVVVTRDGRPDVRADREAAKEHLDTALGGADSAPGHAYQILRGLRNAMAHGARLRWHEVQELLEHEERLRDRLAEIMRTLLDAPLPSGL